jgi:hypothetical protein
MLEPSEWTIVDCPNDQVPLLIVIIDTEADFDWSRAGTRTARGVSSIKQQWQAQKIFDRYAVKPTYVVDYPVSSRPEAYEVIRGIYEAGRCEIGAHLQPWDTPPIVEELDERNSYPGNLPVELERAKLKALTESITEHIGVRPRIYKAGRYGVGRSTPQILAELGYEIDVSVVPGTDLSRQHGPDFSHCDARPYWFGDILELPLSVGFVGLLATMGERLRKLTMNESLKGLHVPGVLARLGLLERITITPEGITVEEQKRVTSALLRRGHRIFSLTYHSPSLAPGNTPYVRNDADLRQFLERIEHYLDFFMIKVGGRAATPFEVKALAARTNPPLRSPRPQSAGRN